MYKRVTTPLDGLGSAEAILPHAQSLAHCLDAEIIASRGMANLDGFSFSDPGITLKMINETEKDAKNQIMSSCEKLETAGMRVSFLIRESLAVGDQPEQSLFATRE